MSLTKSLHDLGRPVVFYPRLGRFFGSNNAAILFAQLSYWTDRTDNPLGVYKTVDELEDETGLTKKEQITARKYLVSKGYLHESHDRLQHRKYYLIDRDAVDSGFSVFAKSEVPKGTSGSAKRDCPEVPKGTSGSAKRDCPEVPKGTSYKGAYSTAEMTTEMTADIKDSTPAACPTAAVAKPAAFDASAWLAQRGVPDDVSADWLAVRKSKRARNSERAFGAIERAANAAGKDLTEWWRQEHGIASGARPSALAIAVEASATYGWSGFDAAWLRNKLGSGGGGTGASWSDREQDRRESVLAAFGVVARHQTMPIADALEYQGGYETDLLGDCDHAD